MRVGMKVTLKKRKKKKKKKKKTTMKGRLKMKRILYRSILYSISKIMERKKILLSCKFQYYYLRFLTVMLESRKGESNPKSDFRFEFYGQKNPEYKVRTLNSLEFWSRKIII